MAYKNLTSENLSYNKDNNFVQVYRSPANEETHFHSSTCREVYHWWRTFAPNGPRRDQFDILEHSDKAPHIFLIEVLEPGIYQYRLHGEEVVRLVGRNSAGQIFSVESPDEDFSRFARYLTEVCKLNTALHSYGTLEDLGRAHIQYEGLVFTMKDDAGEISHVMGILAQVEQPII
ncbi:PAS domain-containing protein [Rhodovibrionaceae bacterium A322]